MEFSYKNVKAYKSNGSFLIFYLMSKLANDSFNKFEVCYSFWDGKTCEMESKLETVYLDCLTWTPFYF